MFLKSVAFKCALLVALTFIEDASARPGASAPASVPVPSPATADVQKIVAEEAHSQLNTSMRTSHKEQNYHHQQHHYPQHGGKLSIVRLIQIIGKVIAPLVGAIIEPLLVNIAKGITWAITYSLATGFEKPPSYEHFIPALHHHGSGNSESNEYEEGDEYESHKAIAYSLKDLPGMALQLTSTVLSESGDQPEHVKTEENIEKKLVDLLLQPSQPTPAQ